MRIFSALPTAVTAAGRRSSMIRVLLCSLSGAAAQSALVLLTGISVWLLPLWGMVLLARSVVVGMCAALCLSALQAGVVWAVPMTWMIAIAFVPTFWWEMRLGILPMLHQRKTAEDDALYLMQGTEYALRYVLFSLVLTAVGLWVFFRMSMLD